MKFILLVGAIILLLNMVMETSHSSLLFYPLYPGILARFFIEGAHGTAPHPYLGPVVEVVVNMLTYMLITFVALSVFRGDKNRKEQPSE
jgi:hypothetical protein